MSSADNCIEVRNLSKKFARSLKRSFLYGASDLGRAVTGRSVRDELRPSEFWALRDVSLNLRRGQSMGLVGANGGGKTTLLRLISGILSPTLGSVRVDGRIAPMLALGAGFKPVLSGRENIFLNLALLGVGEKRVRERLDAIIDFSELHESIDAPLGTYSSGMLARLGFACAVHTDPQILIVDEVLSVGDTRFRTKCRNKINELRRSGTSMLLVSHSSILIETLCDACVYLKAGQVAATGTPSEVLKVYETDQIAAAQIANARKLVNDATDQPENESNDAVTIRSVEVGLADDPTSSYWLTGRPGVLRVEVFARQQVEDLSINMMVFDQTHQVGETILFMTSSRDLGWFRIDGGHAVIELQLDPVGLRAGGYRIKLSLSRGDMHDLIDTVEDVKLVVRDPSRSSTDLYFQPRRWELSGAILNRGPIIQDEIPEINEDF